MYLHMSFSKFKILKVYYQNYRIRLWCLMHLSTICQLYRGGEFYWWRKSEYTENYERGLNQHTKIRILCLPNKLATLIFYKYQLNSNGCYIHILLYLKYIQLPRYREGGYIWTFFSLHQRALSLEDKFSKYISKISSVVMVDACM